MDSKTTNDLNDVVRTVIRHSLLGDKEGYLFSLMNFTNPPVKQIGITIVMTGFERTVRNLYVYQNTNNCDYFKDREGYIYTKPTSSVLPRRCFIENLEPFLESVRKEREKLVGCVLKPAKR